MGFVSSIFRGAKPKAQAAPPAAAPKETPKEEIYGTEDEQAKRALLKRNFGGQDPAALGVTAPATVSRRTLLGPS
jgi:hypothetical protein